jgi:type II secretory pathway component PulJ
MSVRCPECFPSPSAPGFTLVEALVALLVMGGAVAAVLPPLGAALRAKGEREAGLAAVQRAQSLLDALAPPGAAREGRWQGRVPEGEWLVVVGPGEEAGPDRPALRPVRLVLGTLVLETLRPGPPAETLRPGPPAETARP